MCEIEKTCDKCKKTMDICLFTKQASCKNGYRRICKGCSNKRLREYKKRKKEKIALFNKVSDENDDRGNCVNDGIDIDEVNEIDIDEVDEIDVDEVDSDEIDGINEVVDGVDEIGDVINDEMSDQINNTDAQCDAKINTPEHKKYYFDKYKNIVESKGGCMITSFEDFI